SHSCDGITSDSGLAASQRMLKCITPIVNRTDGSPAGSFVYLGRLFSYRQNLVVHGLCALLNRILDFVVGCCHVKSPEYCTLCQLMGALLHKNHYAFALDRKAGLDEARLNHRPAWSSLAWAVRARWPSGFPWDFLLRCPRPH